MTAQLTAANDASPQEDLVNLHIGRRLRRRRKIMGLTQSDLGAAANMKFQQIQKYECAANRVCAARLYTLATALHVPVQYFFDGLPSATGSESQAAANEEDLLASGETHALLDMYYKLPEQARRKLLAFIKALNDEQMEPA